VLLHYTARLCKHVNPEKIYLIHIAKEIDLPHEIADAYPDLIQPLDDTIKHEIQDNLNKHFDTAQQAKSEIIVVEGSVEKQIIHFVKEKDIELVLLGRKTGLRGEGVKANKLAKILPCTLAFIPEVLPSTLKKILVPTDFSENAVMAIEFAFLLAVMEEESVIEAFHAYEVPHGYSRTGKSYEEFSDIMRDNAKKKFTVHIKTLPKEAEGIACKYVLKEDDNESELMYNYAVKEKFDAIVMGSKGRTGPASLLLGSTSEKLLEYNRQIPIFIVKDKKKNMGFIDALLNL
ncbi:MAG: universal stress protein, partial [Bacteroidota bacterium]